MTDRGNSTRVVTWATAAVLVVLLALIAVVVKRTLEAPAAGTACGDCQPRFTFAVFGDYPYTAAQEAFLPELSNQLNADPDIGLVAHLGDIKSDETKCSTDYYLKIKAAFNRFADPFVYTPGDNEWSDCNERSNGRYDPLERLAAIRKVFFTPPGQTLGQTPMAVISDAENGYPENVRWSQAEVQFATFHAVGPRNGLVSLPGHAAPTTAQRREFESRTAAAVTAIRAAFAQAESSDARAIVLFTQADMFAAERPERDSLPYQPIVAALADESAQFGKPVYLFNGDTHEYVNDHPLASDQKWSRLFKVRSADNLTRYTVDGDKNATDYLKVTIRPNFSRVLSVDRITFATR